MENKNITNKKTFSKRINKKVLILSIQPSEQGLPHGFKPHQFNLLSVFIDFFWGVYIYKICRLIQFWYASR